MAYVASIHRPSSVRHAVKLRFLSEEMDSLVVAKANRLEIYEQTSDGLAMSFSRAIQGKITLLQKLTAPSGGLEHLFVGTDRYMYFSLSWNQETQQLRTEKTYVDQAEKIGRASSSAESSMVDPMERFLILALFEGIMTILPLTYKEVRRKGFPETRALGEPLPVRIEELFVRASAFLYPENKKAEEGAPRMALAYTDSNQRCWLQVKQLTCTVHKKGEMDDAGLNNLWDTPRALDISVTHLIPVPTPTCGMIIVSECTITYHDLEDEQNKIIHRLEENTVFSAWEPIDENRWLLADEYGRLYFLMLIADQQSPFRAQGFRLDRLGMISRASVIVYLGGGYAYVGSHSGDSQVIRIQASGLAILQTLQNIAPILDFTIMDMGNRSSEEPGNEYSTGQARIVTGSGAFQDGSLRSVRSGVGLEDLGSLGELGYVVRLFALSTKSRAHDLLLASLIDETRAFRFPTNGEVEELTVFPGFELNEETLIAANIPQGKALQCTKSSARIVDLENGMVVASWNCPAENAIVAATCSRERALLSISGMMLVVLELNDQLTEVVRKPFDADDQVSCIDIPQTRADFCIIGFWNSPNISILELSRLELIRSIPISDGGNAVPRSILLTQILPQSPPTLFIAMADGHVVTFEVQLSTWSLSSRKVTILGTQQANLQPIPRSNGLYNVFATCEHPSIIYGSEGRIVYSAVTAENANCVCSFDSEGYPGAIAIATSDEVKIALVDEEKTTHIQTLPIGETVRRIAYSPKLKAFGLGTIYRTYEKDTELVRSHFKIADEVVFQTLDSYEFDDGEIVESVIRAELQDNHGHLTERFIVGTASIESSGEQEEIRGRIVVFEVTEDRRLRRVLNHNVKGACRALGVMGNKIVAALIKTVVIYQYAESELQRLAAYRTSTASIDLVIVDDLIAIADLMKSVSIVRFLPGEAGSPDKLIEIARHYQIAWSTALAAIDKDTYLEADSEGNLMVLRQNVNGVTADDRRRLEVTSEMQLGEMVNRIRPFHVPITEEMPVIPRALMATVDGSMYLFATIRSDKQDFLMRLQEHIAAHVQSPGGIPFAKYRAFKNSVREAEAPYRFVDGDLIERFLECSPDVQQGICDASSMDINPGEIRLLVEALRRLH